ncbi:hypothetical protein A2U01_0107960, partial [Trifolium medium]|nr:hypothetical protein [Trifolium medium]
MVELVEVKGVGGSEFKSCQ